MTDRLSLSDLAKLFSPGRGQGTMLADLPYLNEKTLRSLIALESQFAPRPPIPYTGNTPMSDNNEQRMFPRAPEVPYTGNSPLSAGFNPLAAWPPPPMRGR